MTGYRKKLLTLLLALMLFTLPALGQQRRVYFAHEAPAFEEGAPVLHLYVADLVGADSMLMVLGEHTMLVDMGKENQAPQILEMLEKVGVSRVSHAFNTHPHSDHLGGMVPLLDRLRVERFYTAFDEDFRDSAVVQRPAIRALKERGIPILRVTQDDVIPFGEAQVRVFQHPKGRTVNQRSAMLHITYGDCTLLLAADVSEWTQTLFGEEYNLKSDVLKYPHHGLSKLNQPFLSSVSPEYTFITHGSANSQEAQKQMDRAGIPYSFASWGPIHLSSDGNTWRVDQWVKEDYIKSIQKYQMQNRFEFTRKK